MGASINECCRYVAQTFTAGISGALAGVNLSIENGGTARTSRLRVAIRRVANGLPTTDVLDEVVLDADNAPLSRLITFPRLIAVTAGTQYAIVVSYDGAPAPGAGQTQGVWVGGTANPYPSGAPFASIDNGLTWFDVGTPPGDLVFRTYVQALPAVAADGPVGYWRFAEAPGAPKALDSSGNQNDGSYLGGVALGVPGALADNTAARLDGVDDSVRVPDSGSLDVGDTFSAEGWIKRDTATKAHGLMLKGFQLIVMSAANANQVWLRKPNVSTIARSNAGVAADDAYHHVAVTKNGAGPGTVRIYIDGQPVTTVDVSPAQVVQDTSGPLYFGSSAGGRADFDEFALYDGVLSATQVLGHVQAGAG